MLIVYGISRLDGHGELLGWQRHGEEEVTTTTADHSVLLFCLSFLRSLSLRKITKWRRSMCQQKMPMCHYILIGVCSIRLPMNRSYSLKKFSQCIVITAVSSRKSFHPP
jgi:hypothetical protein